MLEELRNGLLGDIKYCYDRGKPVRNDIEIACPGIDFAGI